MDYVVELSRHIAYRFNLILPLLPTELHLIVSALFPIYTGAHASLARPSSAAKAPKREEHSKDGSDEDELEEDQQKMEGLSPGDAFIFPVIAGVTLTGLYFVIKWLEDPAILNTILNWYFSIFGILSVARLLTDTMGVLHSYMFPARYSWDGQVWEVQPRVRSIMVPQDTGAKTLTPLPGLLSRLPLPARIHDALWILRELPFQKLDFRFYIYGMTSSHFRLGPHGALGLTIALATVFYYNLIAKPWWLTNLMGFGFAYNVLQIMSPTTFWTGTLILQALFCYDIYFVFFTPIMVTVATTLEIPAKLLFPRPSGPGEDPEKQALSMLGLGDVVLPGIMIGLALRFDLYLFYLRKQQRKSSTADSNRSDQLTKDKSPNPEIIKAVWKPATGGWGERFWIGQIRNDAGTPQHGGTFPKTYFHASLIGYVLGMLCTLCAMHLFGHAQPALLYLVPGVLCSLWATALAKGDMKTMWEFTEAEEEEAADGKKGKAKGMESVFSATRHEKITKRMEEQIMRSGEDSSTHSKDYDKGHRSEDKPKLKRDNSKDGGPTKQTPSNNDLENELFYFSISLPPRSLDWFKSKSTTTFPDSRDEEPNSVSAPTLEDELRQASGSTLDGNGDIGNEGLRQRSTLESAEGDEEV